MHAPQPLLESGTYPSIEDLEPVYCLYDPEFAADPHGTYARMRRAGRSLVRVQIAPGVPATLVIGYHTAVRILHDAERFPADPRIWQESLPPDHPLRPMLEWRPNPLRSAGVDHGRYRRALVDALEVIDLHSVRATVTGVAVPLINSFCGDGRAELMGQYITPLTTEVVNQILGCPADLGDHVKGAVAAMFEATDTEKVNALLADALGSLLAAKRAHPGRDVTSRLVHRADLSDEERFHQLVTLYSAGIEPPRNLIANTVLRMLTDPRYAHDRAGFTPPVRDVVEEVLRTDPPMANLCMSYPRTRVLVDGIWLPAHQPVMISMAACTTDPAIAGDHTRGNDWHLAFATGDHACPTQARSTATLIAAEAVAHLLDALPEMSLDVPADRLAWRPGPFHRALAALPVTFPATHPLIPSPAHL
ncbi:cytochrome P450 [Nocardia brevicatena]|uniref:cytochrome P450 n=1 Tax=Nocardia brevicatena TaxID=37327 RepID=UPI0002F64CE8|nr:cytochrome P450 [Nocardia brevicatena]